MVGTARKYANAPIIEAVIDVRISPRQGLTFNHLRPLGEMEKERHSVVREGFRS